MRLAASVALLLLATPAAADDSSRPTAGPQVGLSYMLSRPVTGESGGADHALVVRGELMRPDVAVGIALEGGYAPGNDEETLRRFAILPMIGVYRAMDEVTLRADVSIGWQLLDGRTRLGNVPVAGTEARGVRAELAIGADAPLSRPATLRARVGLALDAVFPVQVDASTRLGPFVELGLVLAL